jgi:hypothetical protein
MKETVTGLALLRWLNLRQLATRGCLNSARNHLCALKALAAVSS